MGTWLGIDHGTKRIGVAAASTEVGFAAPVETVAAEPVEKAVERIAELAREYRAEGVVVGWPLNMDDTEGPQGRLAREAAVDLAARTGLDVRLWDERLSSFVADSALAGSYTRKKRRARQDAVAAAAILDHFLESDGPGCAPKAGDAVPPEPEA